MPTELTIGGDKFEKLPLFRRGWPAKTQDFIDNVAKVEFNRWLDLMDDDIPQTIPLGGSQDHLADSFTVTKARGKGINIEGQWGSDKLYAWWHEAGTNPHFPPAEELEDWVTSKDFVDHFGNPITESSPDYIIRGMAFVIARSISIKGTEAGGEVQDWLDEHEGRMLDEIMQVLDRAFVKATLDTAFAAVVF